MFSLISFVLPVIGSVAGIMSGSRIKRLPGILRFLMVIALGAAGFVFPPLTMGLFALPYVWKGVKAVSRGLYKHVIVPVGRFLGRMANRGFRGLLRALGAEKLFDRVVAWVRDNVNRIRVFFVGEQLMEKLSPEARKGVMELRLQRKRNRLDRLVERNSELQVGLDERNLFQRLAYRRNSERIAALREEVSNGNLLVGRLDNAIRKREFMGYSNIVVNKDKDGNLSVYLPNDLTEKQLAELKVAVCEEFELAQDTDAIRIGRHAHDETALGVVDIPFNQGDSRRVFVFDHKEHSFTTFGEEMNTEAVDEDVKLIHDRLMSKFSEEVVNLGIEVPANVSQFVRIGSDMVGLVEDKKITAFAVMGADGEVRFTHGKGMGFSMMSEWVDAAEKRVLGVENSIRLTKGVSRQVSRQERREKVQKRAKKMSEQVTLTRHNTLKIS